MNAPRDHGLVVLLVVGLVLALLGAAAKWERSCAVIESCQEAFR
jgi:hypothetical protein